MICCVLVLATLAVTADAGQTAAKRPEIIAHRGESSLAPENTLAAVNLAWKQHADAVEIDVHLTADGHLVVCHDASTKRTADKDLAIAKSTLAELRALRIKNVAGTENATSDEKIPLLAEVLATIPDGRRLFVEVKVGLEAVPVLKKEIAASGKRPEQVVVISFHPSVVREAKRQMPQHKAFLLVGFERDKETQQWKPTVDEAIAMAKETNADGINVGIAKPLDRACVASFRAAGFDVYAWTVDSPDVARRLIGFGVIGITTNRAGWLREQLSQHGRED